MNKLNFWQWLAVVLLIFGIAWIVYDYTHKKETPANPGNPPATQNLRPQ